MTTRIGELGMELDPRMTFETFVVGPANRLASAAARRAAESPGTGYNPLFLYSASGLGKSHILSAIAQHAERHLPELSVMYQTLEGYLDELTHSLQRGGQEDMRDRYMNLDILLLDDVQFLTGQTQAQEMLLRALDALTSREAQVVLASDRPPSEINELDERLLSRFSGGLIVDIGQPDYEMRVAIMRRKASERGVQLGQGVPEALARFPFKNVRELQGALNRILAVQEIEGRPVSVDDLPGIIGEVEEEREADEEEFTELLEGISEPAGPDGEMLEEPAWRRKVHDAANKAKSAGVSADGILRLLDSAEEPENVDARVAKFRAKVSRIGDIRRELDELGNPWPEAAATLLKDADRVEEAENLLASARERVRPFPEIPPGPVLQSLQGRLPALALRAAERLLLAERPDYNPLYVHATNPELGLNLLEAAGRTFLEARPDGDAGLISVAEFADEFIRSMSDGVAGAWRERWWGVDLLLLHGVEQLSSTERAQDEFFHLFEALKRRGARMLLAADRPPARIEGVNDRLRSRFEGGLVVELGGLGSAVRRETGRPAPEAASPRPAEPPSQPRSRSGKLGDGDLIVTEGHGDATSQPSRPAVDARDDLTVLRELAGVPRGRKAPQPGAGGEEDLVVAQPKSSGPQETWFPSREKVIWEWPNLEDRIAEEADDGD